MAHTNVLFNKEETRSSAAATCEPSANSDHIALLTCGPFPVLWLWPCPPPPRAPRPIFPVRAYYSSTLIVGVCFAHLSVPSPKTIRLYNYSILFFIGRVGVLMAFVKSTDDIPTESAALAKQVFAVAEARVGAVPLVEPAEEIRALLLRLCYAVLARDSAFGFGNEVLFFFFHIYAMVSCFLRGTSYFSFSSQSATLTLRTHTKRPVCFIRLCVIKCNAMWQQSLYIPHRCRACERECGGRWD